MPGSLPHRHRALVGAIILLAVALALAAAALLDRERAMQQLSKEQVYWSVAQAEIELYRFVATLEAYGRDEAVDHDEVVKRFDIFWSRMGLFEAGDIASRALAFPGAAEAVADARSVMVDEEQAVLALKAGDTAEIGRLHDRFDEAGLALHRLAVAVNQAETEALAELRRELRREVVALVAIVGGMVSGGAVLVLLLLRENRRNRELALLNRQFVAASDVSERGIVLSRRQGEHLLVFYANAAFRALCGPGAVEGRETRALFAERFGPAFSRPIEETLALARPMASSELPTVRHGAERWCRLLTTPVANEDGVVDAMMIVVEDVSAEVETRHAMTAARDAAMQANTAKSRFVAVMSHEIRTPMNGVLGALGLIAQRNRDAELVGLIDTARSSGEALLAILNDVLDITRMEAEQLHLDPAPLDLPALVDSVCAAWAPLAAEKGVALGRSIAPDVPRHVTADAARLRQMLVNLVSNAVKFTDTGEIAIDLRPGAEGRIRFEVSDTGPGIAASERRRLFREYDQVAQHGRGGTGLGLAIVRRLARLMGGEVGVESEPGQGSRFFFELALPPSAPPARRSAREALALDGLDVLVAEDNATNRLIISEILKDLGCRVRLAEDGAQAVAMAAEAAPDVVLMDIAMPVMDGREAHRRLREGPGALAALPVVAVTAYAMADEVADFLAEGFDAVLAKPVVKEKLAETLGRLTGRLPVTMPEPPAMAAGEGEVDRDALENLFASLGPEIATKLAESFVTDVDAALGRIDAAIGAGDVQRLERDSHILAGLAATFGLSGLSAEARILNRACRAGQRDEAVDAAARLTACGRRGLEAFRRLTAAPGFATMGRGPD